MSARRGLAWVELAIKRVRSVIAPSVWCCFPITMLAALVIKVTSPNGPVFFPRLESG